MAEEEEKEEEEEDWLELPEPAQTRPLLAPSILGPSINTDTLTANHINAAHHPSNPA